MSSGTASRDGCPGDSSGPSSEVGTLSVPRALKMLPHLHHIWRRSALPNAARRTSVNSDISLPIEDDARVCLPKPPIVTPAR